MTLPAKRPERQNRRLAMQLTDVMAEMARQDEKWGARRELFDVNPRIDMIVADPHRACVVRDIYQIPGAARARQMVDSAKGAGMNEWGAIALEEFCEALEAKCGPERRRELVQLTAVLLQWIDNIDRREIRQREADERRNASKRKRAASRNRILKRNRRTARKAGARRAGR